MSAQNSIKQSASKIFKFIFNLFKNIYRFPGHVFYTIKRIGSFPAAIKKTIKIYQKEGFLGVRDRFKKIVQIRKKQSYQLWIHYLDTLTPETRANMKSHIKKFSAKPLISIVMPTYNTKPQWLIEVIESVKNQIYTHWELCIADDASTDPEVRSILERYAKEDSRIKVTFRPKNGHISESSNTAIKLATGKWIALLDHDDLLSENALFWVVNAINQKPDVKLIYSDEDKIDEMGIRQDPYFKCDWNVDLFYSHNLITHL